jgi:RNA polymerase sigma-70 factor (ECF subfamily)
MTRVVRRALDAAGDLVTLEDQDRTLWNQTEIAEGTALLERTLRRGRAGPFQIQAAIAACHATARDASETDWPQIVGLYAQLKRVAPTAVVELNQAVAIAMTDGPQVALPLVDAVASSGQLEDYYLLHAARADLLRRAGRPAEARQSYQAALDRRPDRG